MSANEVFKQDGAKSIVASKVYHIVYCLEIKHSLGEVWWQIWYLLKCPLIGYGSLAEAQLGAKFQTMIIGETDGDFESVDFDGFFGISVIGGLDAGEFEFPNFLLEESWCL